MALPLVVVAVVVVVVHLPICLYFSKHFHTIPLVPRKTPARKLFSHLFMRKGGTRGQNQTGQSCRGVYGPPSRALPSAHYALPLDRNTAVMLWKRSSCPINIRSLLEYSQASLAQFLSGFLALVIGHRTIFTLSLKIFMEKNSPEAQEEERQIWMNERWWQGKCTLWCASPGCEFPALPSAQKSGTSNI